MDFMIWHTLAFTGKREGEKRGLCLERRIQIQAAVILMRKGRVRKSREHISCSHQFQKRQCRRHTNIPKFLPWLDNLAAKGKFLCSSVFQDQK